MNPIELYVEFVSVQALLDSFVNATKQVFGNVDSFSLRLGPKVIINLDRSTKKGIDPSDVFTNEDFQALQLIYGDLENIRVTSISASKNNHDFANIQIVRKNSGYYLMTVSLSEQRRQAPLATFSTPLNTLKDHFTLMSPQMAETDFVSVKSVKDSVTRTIEIREQAAKSLELINRENGAFQRKLLENTTNFIRECTEGIVERSEKRRQEIETALKEREAELDEKERKYLERVAQLNLDTNMAQRRQLLEDMKDLIQRNIQGNDVKALEEIEFDPEGTAYPKTKVLELLKKTSVNRVELKLEKKREPIRLACISSMVFFGLMMAAMLTFILWIGAKNPNDINWVYFLPFTTSTLIFASTLVFYLRWNDQWFKQNARIDFSNRKLYADVLRANWLAELFFESDESKNKPLPDQLVSSFTTDLFRDRSWQDNKSHPIDELTDLAKQFDKLKVGGFEVQKGGGDKKKEEDKEKSKD